MTALTLNSKHRCFGGTVIFHSHFSQTCQNEMRFAVYLPPQAELGPVPVLYFLAGLTSTEENFIAKAGAQRLAAEAGLMLVAPDTSPRNTSTPGEDTDWDLGTGAGFYVNAIAEPWQQHYQMYSYVVEELPALIAEHFPADGDRQGICGHSMGGHGALVCGLRNPDRFQSVSAFAPIAAPMQCPWGQKAFNHYLGEDQSLWSAYDASQLVLQAKHPQTILVDQGMADPWLEQQLKIDQFEQACTQAGQSLMLRRQAGYDHNYFFIASFMADHIRHHALALKN
jgi:S-formylglutathione hydrolase